MNPSVFTRRLDEQIDTARRDVPILGLQRREHPYIGLVESTHFRLRKSVGQPWDHFSPKCHGTVEGTSDGGTRVEYHLDRRTRAWWLCRAALLAGVVALGAMTLQAARDMVEETEVVANGPAILIAIVLGFAAVSLFFVIKFARQMADIDAAELDYLIRSVGDLPAHAHRGARGEVESEAYAG